MATTKYDAYADNAASYTRSPYEGGGGYSKDTVGSSMIARAINGLTYAVLALAESNRPAPVEVQVTTNAAEVAATVAEKLKRHTPQF